MTSVPIMDYRDRRHRITRPMLGVWGEHDRLIPKEQAELVRPVANGGKVPLIPGLFLFWENIQAVDLGKAIGLAESNCVASLLQFDQQEGVRPVVPP